MPESSCCSYYVSFFWGDILVNLEASLFHEWHVIWLPQQNHCDCDTQVFGRLSKSFWQRLGPVLACRRCEMQHHPESGSFLAYQAVLYQANKVYNRSGKSPQPPFIFYSTWMQSCLQSCLLDFCFWNNLQNGKVVSPFSSASQPHLEQECGVWIHW